MLHEDEDGRLQLLLVRPRASCQMTKEERVAERGRVKQQSFSVPARESEYTVRNAKGLCARRVCQAPLTEMVFRNRANQHLYCAVCVELIVADTRRSVLFDKVSEFEQLSWEGRNTRVLYGLESSLFSESGDE